MPRVVERTWMKVEDILFLAARHFDHVQGRLVSDYTFIKDGQVETRSASYRLYLYREFVELFESAGFTIVVAETLETCGATDHYARERLATKPFAFGAANLLITLERSR
jgi:hypothetical protein